MRITLDIDSATSEQAVRVCPVCREQDSEPEFWSARCEAAWQEEQARVRPQS